jgi:two-component system chemotaxis response regulator CheY
MTIRALVIDDSKVMRSMVMQSLQKTRLADFEFIEAQDGADALEKFDPDEIDIVFADWNMPNMSGIDFVREVRAMTEPSTSRS